MLETEPRCHKMDLLGLRFGCDESCRCCFVRCDWLLDQGHKDSIRLIGLRIECLSFFLFDQSGN